MRFNAHLHKQSLENLFNTFHRKKEQNKIKFADRFISTLL